MSVRACAGAGLQIRQIDRSNLRRATPFMSAVAGAARAPGDEAPSPQTRPVDSMASERTTRWPSR